MNNGNFITWSGIDTLKFKKLICTPQATHLGHLDQERENLQSIKKEDTVDEDTCPSKIPSKTRDNFYTIYTLSEKEKSIY